MEVAWSNMVAGTQAFLAGFVGLSWVRSKREHKYKTRTRIRGPAAGSTLASIRVQSGVFVDRVEFTYSDGGRIETHQRIHVSLEDKVRK